MELRQRKRINNLPRFDTGQDIRQQSQTDTSQSAMNKLDAKVGFGSQGGVGGSGIGSQQSVANSVTQMVGSNAPAGSAIAGGGSSSPSFNIGQKPFSQWNPKGGMNAGGGGGVSAGAVTGAVNGTLGLISGYNSMQDSVKDANELTAQSGQRTDQAFGVNYQAQNDINSQKAMDDISKSTRDATLSMVGSGAAAGAAVGSCFPGLGTVIGGAAGAIVGLFGGLFGSKKAKERQRKKIFNAQQKVNLVNQINQSSAATEGLTQQYYLDNGNTKDDVLYANRGKDLRKPRYVKRK